MSGRIKIGFLLLFITLSFYGQNVKSLESKKTRLKEDLKLTSKMLKEVSKERKTSLGELSILNKQLENRNKLIQTLQQETSTLNAKIDSNKVEILYLEVELTQSKEDYGKLLREAYKNKSKQSLLLFLFSADSFNDAYRRLKYVRFYNDYRIQQAEKIRKTQEKLEEKNKDLLEQKKELDELLAAEAEQGEKLLVETKKKNGLVADLKKKERVLQSDLDKKRVSIEQLEGQIKSIIQKEIAVANAASKTPSSGTKNKPSSSFKETPEIKALSKNFANNKGKLPWPVKKGIITGRFGIGRHSEASNVKINNSGVDISTPQGSEVRVVFDGVISQIIYSPSFQSAIIVKHGSYFTVYSNLSSVTVSKGQKVSTNEVIGQVSTDGATGKSEVHFEVWKATTKMNPEGWMKK